MKPKVIALEEHYLDPEVARHFKEPGPEARDPALRERLADLGALRIREMDEAGIDIQVLSHSAPATQRLDAESAPALARAANDRLRERVQASRGRFEAFAALPTANPQAAADELERAVTKLGFKGAMVHGLTNGIWFDDKRVWPIFERARALDVPRALLDHHQRQLLDAGAHLLRARDGRRPHPFLRRLSLRAESARRALDGPRAAGPGRSGKDLERQCKEIAQDLIPDNVRNLF